MAAIRSSYNPTTGRIYAISNTTTTYPSYGFTYSGNGGLEPIFETTYNRRVLQAQQQDGAEELDNLLEDYMEELKASEETTVDVADVINKLQGMQKSVQDKIRDNGPDVDSDFERLTPEFEELRDRATRW